MNDHIERSSEFMADALALAARESAKQCKEIAESRDLSVSYCDDESRLVAKAIQVAISSYKLAGRENEGAFSVIVYQDEEGYSADCTFSEDDSMTIMYNRAETNEYVVDQLFRQEGADHIIQEMASVMLENGWID